MSVLSEERKKSRLAGPSSKKVKFTKVEDAKLAALINEYGETDWKIIAEKMAPRTARQCRERWTNYVNPSLSKDPWTKEEDALLLEKHEEYGNRWKLIEKFFPTRSKNNIKHRYSQIKEVSSIPAENLQLLDDDLSNLASYDNSEYDKFDKYNALDGINNQLSDNSSPIAQSATSFMLSLNLTDVVSLSMDREPIQFFFDRILDQSEMSYISVINKTDLWAIPDDSCF
ncbi:DNA-binding protein reb1 [Tritrichomonas foetus]|uniref:DNA-binding protein reb1 n=1 Tax=Tritrichomonas foetus TaxID=1144522 RepID=A0A1J4K5N1_9EUKA|nr:DNA-binding protein reb1 [Tritrichomonas foetus]|eukprot:OHT04781.1 DNA-binding protein reb1 [Tritrichomonas foetus]